MTPEILGFPVNKEKQFCQGHLQNLRHFINFQILCHVCDLLEHYFCILILKQNKIGYSIMFGRSYFNHYVSSYCSTRTSTVVLVVLYGGKMESLCYSFC